VPFLDHRVVEYAWQLPPAIKYANKTGSKHLLRQLLYRHVPRELVDRPKKGFSSPLPVWLRGPLRDWAEDLLDERRLDEEGLFDARALRTHWNQHLSAASDFWQIIWSVLVFRQWHRHWEAEDPRRMPNIHPHGCALTKRSDHDASDRVVIETNGAPGGAPVLSES
jgi:asparagine synthase (glutamine-hydrolysing)